MPWVFVPISSGETEGRMVSWGEGLSNGASVGEAGKID